MSDTDPADSALLVDSQAIERLNRARRQIRRSRNSVRASEYILQLLNRLVPSLTIDELRELSQFQRSMARNLRTRGEATGTTGEGENIVVPVSVPQAQSALKPATTLVSMLPKTPYNEVKEAEGTMNTPSYTKVQLALLEYLNKHASEKLTVRQAHNWTERIADNMHPAAKDALRLCYYMRSQGFDTYADVRDGSIELYLSKQAPEKGRSKASLYWKQNYSTNAIEHTVFEAYIPPRPARYDDFMPSELSGTQLLDALLAGPGPPIPQHAGGPGEDVGDQAAPVPEGDQTQEDVEPTEHNVATMLAVAQADLEAQFMSDTPDSEYVSIPFQSVTPTNKLFSAVEALLARIEQLNSQE
ncbi:hypothetical protein J4E86_002448 [Alternaria arbusti]|uniref:uncharacterized protein n=1 Tax=Alternaria arbusti TaxID=232088 RepID=UPI00221F952E|nr:uncharacterized protein J4E86_002448 [Alternaria arbusti]KAI4960823.1 hypothetical protein J4E86_002448 [Alternaria arbusti]